MFVLMKAWISSNFGHLGSSTRSVGQIKAVPRGYASSHDLRLIDQFSSQLKKR